ncbi:LysE family translocator [Pleurocapsa sp. FMAR1]|uniref:LysE family translocator n=1 Tax=Pleurocapsa sp. FMAR1 TaxID=3040204 RepID=UPI0029C863DA|nr:LysE family translocator [Pleurocapsa sp. FMAR1]
MNELLPPWSLLTTFLAASFVLAVTPGPGVFYIVTRSLAQGRRSGLASVAGVALGNLGNAIGASVGLAAVFAVSSVAFTIVKYAGALYLVYLGIQVLRSEARDAEASPVVVRRRSGLTPCPSGLLPESEVRKKLNSAQPWRIFRDGFIVALLNPKTAIFFAAFLPQFMETTTPMLQSVMLGALFVAIAATTDTVYALTAGSIAPTLARAKGFRQLGRYMSGGAFIGLGMMTAFAGRSSK